MIVVQIGTNTAAWKSNDGEINFDPCLEFVIKNQKEIEFLHLVEPIKYCLPFIEEAYSFFKNKKIHNIAITDNSNQKEIEIFLPKNDKTSGHSSFNSNHLLVLGHTDIESIKVPCYTLNDFFKMNSINRCDKLFIDTEGMDCLILLDYDYNKFKTNYIEFEIAHSDGPFTKSINADKCLSRLTSDGFSITNSLNDPLNLVASKNG